ncbi:MAG TPA: lamin tail domain-containing protein [Vicinamibacterales bacterium]|nr:lamin tail domain-containing protein [Vicinamibacterales bacterium]
MKKLCVALACACAVVVFPTSNQTRLYAQAGSSVVISEFRTRGPQGGNDEFVELFNASASSVDISGWKISGSNSAGTTSVRATIAAGTTLGAGCFFLAVNTGSSGYSGTTPGNLTYTTGITDDGGVALSRSDNTIVDQVGMSAGSAFGEGPRLTVLLTTNVDRSYARTPTPGADTDDNAADFALTTPSGPQNLASVDGCGGTPPVDQGKAVISQIYGGGGNSGSVFSNDFIEIFNPGPSAVNLAGWSVQYGSSTGTTWSVTALSGTIAPGRYHLVQEGAGTTPSTALPPADSTGTINLAATAGKVALVRSVTALSGACPTGGDIVDLVGYDGANCSEGSAAPTLTASLAALRGRAGCTDTNNNAADFSAGAPTPRNSASAINDCAALPEIWSHDVQGSSLVSPLVGQQVAVRGIVTAKRFNNGFFIQTPDDVAALEADPASSEGLFVFTSVAPTVNIGDDVVVTGTVSEFSPTADLHQPPVTEIIGPVIVVRATGQPLPAPIVLTSANLTPDGGPLQLERYEGMRVAAGGLTVIAPTSGTVNEQNATGSNNGVFYAVLGSTPRPFREAGIDVIDPAPVCDEHAAGACAIPVFDGNPERLRIDSDGQVGVFPGAIVSTGATMTITAGVLDYAFRTWTILPDLGALTILSPGISAQAVPARSTSNEYLIATFNLERFFDTSDAAGKDDAVLAPVAYANRLAKASLIVRDYLRAPDILGVEEAENLTVLQELAAKIDVDASAASQTAPGYQALLLEGNDIGGIDVGLLVRSNVTVHSVVQWRPDETYINPLNGMAELLNDRPSLVLDATVQGPATRLPAHVIVVVNHLRSLNSVDDPVDGPRVRAKRKSQGESVAQLLIDLQAQYPDVPIVSVGDYNAFDVNDGYVDVLGIIKGTQAPPEQVVDWSALGLNPNFVEALAPGDYSYSFDGNAQTLDHVLLSSTALSTLTGIHHARIDADFPEALRADALRPERLSDHDPAVARFSFPRDTIPPVFDPAVDVSAAATSFDGATVTFSMPTATDNLDPSVPVSCAPVSGAFFSVGRTTVTCTAKDLAGNSASLAFIVTVDLPDDAGTMVGGGQINPGPRVVFNFGARRASTSAERGRLQIIATRPRESSSKFAADALDDVVFLGAAVRITGRGMWNGVDGFTFVAEATDNGEPGGGMDLFSIVVRGPQGDVVLQAGGLLNGGNVQKVR